MTKEEFWAAFRPLAAGMSARQIARELETSFTSTARWVKGASAPTAVARPAVVERLRQVVERRERERAEEAARIEALAREMEPSGEELAVLARTRCDVARAGDSE